MPSQQGSEIGQDPFVRAGIRTVSADLVIGIVLFVSSGDLGWRPAWAYMVILAVSSILPLYGPIRFDEGLIRERMSRHPDAKPWDKYFVGLVGLFTAAELIIPGLDHRFGWTGPLPTWRTLLGLFLVVFGTALFMWSMRANRFFSAFIRIQKDREHQVVRSGPYRIVRHPGYAFWSVRTFGVPLLFQSNWAFVVAGLFVAMFILRTALEDQVLQKELAGYREYANSVKWKLIRGVW